MRVVILTHTGLSGFAQEPMVSWCSAGAWLVLYSLIYISGHWQALSWDNGGDLIWGSLEVCLQILVFFYFLWAGLFLIPRNQSLL